MRAALRWELLVLNMNFDLENSPAGFGRLLVQPRFLMSLAKNHFLTVFDARSDHRSKNVSDAPSTIATIRPMAFEMLGKLGFLTLVDFWSFSVVIVRLSHFHADVFDGWKCFFKWFGFRQFRKHFRTRIR